MVQISGGDKLAAALNDISKKLSSAGTLRVGFLENAKYPDGTPVALVAAVQEFGAPSKGIPPRPFFRNMIAKHSKEWPKAIGDDLVNTDYDVDATLNRVGELISSELVQSIFDLMSPPLSPVTVMLRGMSSQSQYRDMDFWSRFKIAKERVVAGKTNYGASTKPLVDTGHLSNSVTYDVKT